MNRARHAEEWIGKSRRRRSDAVCCHGNPIRGLTRNSTIDWLERVVPPRSGKKKSSLKDDKRGQLRAVRDSANGKDTCPAHVAQNTHICPAFVEGSKEEFKKVTIQTSCSPRKTRAGHATWVQGGMKESKTHDGEKKERGGQLQLWTKTGRNALESSQMLPSPGAEAKTITLDEGDGSSSGRLLGKDHLSFAHGRTREKGPRGLQTAGASTENGTHVKKNLPLCRVGQSCRGE